MQRNISIGYVSKLVAKHTGVAWNLLPANEIEKILRDEGVIIKQHIYAGRDDTYGCLIFVPRSIGYLAGSVKPETIIHEPETVLSASEDQKDNEGQVN